MLQQALAMSMASVADTGEDGGGDGGGDNAMDVDDDGGLAAALAMSAGGEAGAAAPGAEAFSDPNFVNSLLSGLPGVDPNDPSLQAAINGGGAASSGGDGAAAAAASATTGQFEDPAFINSMLAGLPGVDINDPQLQAALAGATGAEQDGDEETNKDKDKK